MDGKCQKAKKMVERGKKQGRDDGWKVKWRKSGDEREGAKERERRKKSVEKREKWTVGAKGGG
jgi:hypothetical protein